MTQTSEGEAEKYRKEAGCREMSLMLEYLTGALIIIEIRGECSRENVALTCKLLESCLDFQVVK